jgi:hypothetical protein
LEKRVAQAWCDRAPETDETTGSGAESKAIAEIVLTFFAVIQHSVFSIPVRRLSL